MNGIVSAKVLSYYIDCVHLQERTQNYLVATKINKEFYSGIWFTLAWRFGQ